MMEICPLPAPIAPLPPACARLAPPCAPPPPDADGWSSRSSSGAAMMEDPDHHRIHHLLKHSLPTNHGDALQHFGTDDVKEAARDISRMGQRELQSKFKLVYGSATHSNNNDWLRRKLYEAIGAAPVKAACKVKARKPAASKARKHSAPASPTATAQHAGARRIPGASTSPRAAGAAAGAARHWAGMPSSPLMGVSVLELHRFHSTISQDTSTESDHSSSPAASGATADKATSAEVTSAAPLPALRVQTARPAPTPAAPAQPPAPAAAQRRPVAAGLYSVDAAMQNAEWANNACGELSGCLRGPGPAAATEDDDDVMMLQLDLSAFDSIF